MGREYENGNDVDALRVVGTLTLLNRAIDQQFRQASDGDELSVAELGVLSKLQLGCDLPSAIARTVRLDPGRVTRMMDRLVSLGYVTRDVDRADRRRWRHRLTTAGETRLAIGRAQVRQAMSELLDDLSAEERTGLAQGLEGVRRVLDASVGPGQAVAS
jgi:DNA-binding MarR family transcriptional regulator